MYKITVQTLTGNEHTIFYPANENFTLLSGKLSLKVGSAGEFNFVVPSENPYYSEIVDHSIITIYKDNAEIWRGDIKDVQVNFDKSLSVYVLEDLAWLGEEPCSMVAVTDETYGQRFTNVMSAYNNNRNAKKQFLQGVLTSVSSSDLCSWKPDYEETLLEGIRSYIAKDGYVRIRRETSQGVTNRYVDIIELSDYGKQSTQPILFGSNLLDFVKDLDTSNFLNVLYPYGAETDEKLYGDTMQRIVGTPIQNNDSIAAFGRVARSVIFETESQATLDRLALAYLNRYSQPHMTIECKAVDLSNFESVQDISLGDSVRVKADVFGIDQWTYVTKLEIDLFNFANNKIELSDSVRVRTLTEQIAVQAQEIDEQQTAQSILAEAKANAYEILNSQSDGVISYATNENGQKIEERIANNLDIEQATKAWRWNLNGLGYLHRTYPSDDWTVGIAMTMDGQIVADYITTGTLNADRVKVKGKIEATSGYIGSQYQGWNIGSKAVYNGPSNIDDTTTPGMYVGADGIRTNGSLWGHSGASTLIKAGAIDSNSTIKAGVVFAGSGQFNNSLSGGYYELGENNSIGILKGRFNNKNGMTIQSTPDSHQFAFLQVEPNRWVPWTSASDRRLKENIEPISVEFIKDFFERVNPVSFNFINDDNKKTEYGLIAQELEEVFDNLGEDNENIIIKLEGEEQYKAINYEKLVGLLIPAVKDLYAQIDELKNVIKILKEEKHNG